MQSLNQGYYFCHPCQKTVRILIAELVCPICGSDFLQEAKIPETENDSDLFTSNLRSLFRFNLERPNQPPNFFRVIEENSLNGPESIRNINDILRSLLSNFHAHRYSDDEEEDEDEEEKEMNIQNEILEKDDYENDCKICTANFLAGEERLKLTCSHLYHTQCLEPWLKIKRCCPFCRQRI